MLFQTMASARGEEEKKRERERKKSRLPPEIRGKTFALL
jgi:hypothetical protein